MKIDGFLCNHFNIEDGRKSNIFSFIIYYALLRKTKMQLKCKKKKSVVYEEGTVISIIYHAEDSQHTKNIQNKNGKSFAPAWLCSLL